MELTVQKKSELCQACGECCKFFVLEVKKPPTFQECKVWEEWMAARGLTIIRTGDRTWRIKFPWSCPKLSNQEGKWTCDVYEGRPILCQKFDGRLEDARDGLQCLWKKEYEKQ